MRRTCPSCGNDVDVTHYDNTADKCQSCVAKDEQRMLKYEI